MGGNSFPQDVGCARRERVVGQHWNITAEFFYGNMVLAVGCFGRVWAGDVWPSGSEPSASSRRSQMTRE